jgi:hypothetical protein
MSCVKGYVEKRDIPKGAAYHSVGRFAFEDETARRLAKDSANATISYVASTDRAEAVATECPRY